MLKTIVGIFSILVLLPLGAAAQSQQILNLQNEHFENRLQPFSSDGCSLFPDGFPYKNENMWLKCCIEHDVAYWQGGTSQQRQEADQQLGVCVGNKAAAALGVMMKWGVRLGGNGSLPLSWAWGYGWTFQRGDAPLSESEKSKVEIELSKIDVESKDLHIVSPPVLRQKKSVTGDFCLDKVSLEISKFISSDFYFEEAREVITETARGFFHQYNIKIQGCEKPFTAELQVLGRNTCKAPASELSQRGQFRLLSFHGDASC